MMLRPNRVAGRIDIPTPPPPDRRVHVPRCRQTPTLREHIRSWVNDDDTRGDSRKPKSGVPRTARYVTN